MLILEEFEERDVHDVRELVELRKGKSALSEFLIAEEEIDTENK